MDLKGSVEKTVRLIKEASASGAKVIGFPELFIPGRSHPNSMSIAGTYADFKATPGPLGPTILSPASPF